MAKEATVTQIKAGDTSAAKNTAIDKGGRRRAPENETPRDRFKRIAGGRMENVLSGLKLLGQMQGGDYEFGEADVAKIEAAVNKAVTEAVSALRGQKKEKQATALFD